MLISFTGIDGCGKGTQIELLTEHLEDMGEDVAVSKAYGDREKELFSIFMRKWDQKAILFLFQAFHVKQCKKAKRNLEKGKMVVADRWDESYLAYHSTHGILSEDPELREQLNKIAFEGIVPDETFLIDVSIETARERMSARGSDFFDELPDPYHLTMREQYKKIVREREGHIIDGEQSIEEIHNEIIKHLSLSPT